MAAFPTINLNAIHDLVPTAARWGTQVWLALMLLLVAGCATPSPESLPPAFRFDRDALAFTNETVWEYRFDPVTGRQTHQKREPSPAYSLHCFPMAAAAKQFHRHARFEPTQSPVSNDDYRRRSRAVLTRSPRRTSEDPDRVIFPGYAGLRDFSAHHGPLLQALIGGAWQSYVQRGNWRMIFPFGRGHQVRTAERFVAEIAAHDAPVAHVVTFPALTINHALVLYDVVTMPEQFRFTAYDPNSPEAPVSLVFNRRNRRFHLAPTHYFIGDEVDVYEVYGDVLH